MAHFLHVHNDLTLEDWSADEDLSPKVVYPEDIKGDALFCQNPKNLKKKTSLI